MRKLKSHSDITTSIDQETVASEFTDVRIGKRFRKLLDQLSKDIGQSIPTLCQDWANTKAAYRFFSNRRVSEKDILKGHFESTRERFAGTEGRVLIVHDTTEFGYQRKKPHLIGSTTSFRIGREYDGSPRLRPICGLFMHSSLVVTTEGLPLGLAAAKLWSRKASKGCNAMKKKINPTRVPIEKKESMRWLENIQQSNGVLGAPERCVHVGDRGGDIFELFGLASIERTNFLVRICVDRLTAERNLKVSEKMKGVKFSGHYWIEVRDKDGNAVPVMIAVKFARIRILPPQGKINRYSARTLSVIYAREVGNPRNRERIDWKLITNLPVKSPRAAIEKIRWYTLRWKIELFHKILKSGCKVEESKMRTKKPLANFIATSCILAWRIFWMTMLRRTNPEASPTLALSTLEMSLLDRIKKDRIPKAKKSKSLSDYLLKIAKLGGYLARASDPPPGIKVMWRGLSRLTDIEFGYMLRAETCG